MSTIRGIVNQVLAGQAQLDVPTAQKLIKAAIKDKSIGLQTELAPLEDLFERPIEARVHPNAARVEQELPTSANFVDSLSGKRWTQKLRDANTVDPNFADRSIADIMEHGISDNGMYELVGELKPSVKSTVSGKRMLESFLYGAKKLHDEEGSSKSKKVRRLKSLAVWNTARLVSSENIIDLLDKYQGSMDRIPSTKYAGYTHAHLANHDIEAVRLGASSALTRYLEGGSFYRLFVSDKKADQLENDPLANLRSYLEGHYENA